MSLILVPKWLSNFLLWTGVGSQPDNTGLCLAIFFVAMTIMVAAYSYSKFQSLHNAMVGVLDYMLNDAIQQDELQHPVVVLPSGTFVNLETAQELIRSHLTDPISQQPLPHSVAALPIVRGLVEIQNEIKRYI